ILTLQSLHLVRHNPLILYIVAAVAAVAAKKGNIWCMRLWLSFCTGYMLHPRHPDHRRTVIVQKPVFLSRQLLSHIPLADLSMKPDILTRPTKLSHNGRDLFRLSIILPVKWNLQHNG